MAPTKEFLLLSYFEELETNPSFMTKRMFGALAVYLNGLNVAVLSESPGDRTYRGIKYKFDIWDGVLIPTNREFHLSLQAEFPELVPHPVLGKWLFLPQQTENFDEILTRIIRLIRRKDIRIGILPGQKKKRAKSKKIKSKKVKKY